jgi:hypothetical protein
MKKNLLSKCEILYFYYSGVIYKNFALRTTFFRNTDNYLHVHNYTLTTYIVAIYF